MVSATAGNGRFRLIHWMPMRNLMGHSSGASARGRCTLGGAEQCVDDARKFREQAVAAALYDVALCWTPVPTADPAFVWASPYPAPRRPAEGSPAQLRATDQNDPAGGQCRLERGRQPERVNDFDTPRFGI